MKNKIKLLIALGILFLIFISLVIVNLSNNKETENKSNEYQGAVPLCYDEQYFRETGITQKLSNYEECLENIKA